mmetsp:Transcript_85173/g.237744  ORF Transcript_85173/g.237744 Transcript_85173/m.237744 type:complete len:218 (-) Transcript_85173:611-1264(-)
MRTSPSRRAFSAAMSATTPVSGPGPRITCEAVVVRATAAASVRRRGVLIVRRIISVVWHSIAFSVSLHIHPSAVDRVVVCLVEDHLDRVVGCECDETETFRAACFSIGSHVGAEDLPEFIEVCLQCRRVGCLGQPADEDGRVPMVLRVAPSRRRKRTATTFALFRVLACASSAIAGVRAFAASLAALAFAEAALLSPLREPWRVGVARCGAAQLFDY